MISALQVSALTAHLAKRYACTVFVTTSSTDAAARMLLTALAAPVPALAVVVDAARDTIGSLSITLPTPLGTLVLLSSEACADPVTHAATLAHECTHASQAQRLGSWQTAVDYLASGELRATREAHACVAAAFVRYLLTGVLPASASEIVATLESHLYLLSSAELTLALDLARSSLASMVEGAVPPIGVCHEVLTWLQAEAPGAIEAAPWVVATVPA